MTTRFAAGLIATLCAAAALAQTSTNQIVKASQSSSSPAAYLYFSEYTPGHASLTPGQGETQIEGYSVAADGSLTKISGAPFAVGGYTTQIAVNGKYLFASTHIELGNNQFPKKMNSYKISSVGALTLSHVLGNADLTNITLDRTGETLYGQLDGTTDLLSYEVRWADGGLEYLGQVTAHDLAYEQAWQDLPVTFSADNKYAFGTTDASYLRAGNHELVRASTAVTQPVSFALAADPNNNLAGIADLGFNASGFAMYGIASYQVASDGTLTTTATAENVPRLNSSSFDTLSVSPSGKFLAVSAGGEVQIFHWNGAAPVTPFADLPLAYYPGVPNQVGGVGGSAVILLWDNANHLFAYEEGFTPAPSGSNGYLYVWTVTADGVTSAPGSPLEFQNPISTVAEGPGMAVQALTTQTQ
jgi:hypothetical protein